jgi:hypothetical protein
LSYKSSTLVTLARIFVPDDRANQAKRCTVNLNELEQVWRAEAEAQLAEMLEAQAKYDAFEALPLIVLHD